MDLMDEVVPSNVIGCCRICLGHEGEFYDVFSDGEIEEGVRIAQILRECTSYTVELSDNITHRICRICLENAIFSYRFRRQADNSYCYLTGVMEMPQKSAMMLVEMATQTDEFILIEEEKQQQLKEEFDYELDMDQALEREQQTYNTFNNNNSSIDNNLLNDNDKSNQNDSQLTYENQTVGFESMLLYDNDNDDNNNDDGDDMVNGSLMRPISSSSLTSTIEDLPERNATAATTTTPPTKVEATAVSTKRKRRQYRNTKQCTITTDCKLCGAKHNCLLELRDHLMVEHMFIELILGLQCRLCDHEYSRKDHLVRHLRNIHKVSRDREDGRINIEEPQTITMGQFVNDNDANEENVGNANRNYESSDSDDTLESTFGVETITADTGNFKNNHHQSSSKTASFSSSSLSRQKCIKMNDAHWHEPEFVRSGDELLNFKVKVLRTKFSQCDDPLMDDTKNVVNVNDLSHNDHEIDDELNVITDKSINDEPDEKVDDIGDNGIGIVSDTRAADIEDSDYSANLEATDQDDHDDDMEDIKEWEDDDNGVNEMVYENDVDEKTCLNFIEDNKALTKPYALTNSFEQQQAFNNNNNNYNNRDDDCDEGEDGDDDGGGIGRDENDNDDDNGFMNTNYAIQTIKTFDSSKNHMCNICNRKFQRKFHLVRHMLVHTKVRAFSCEKCYRTFSRSDQKAQHRKDGGCKSLRRIQKKMMNGNDCFID